MNTAIKVIKTEQDHAHAVAHLLQLMATGSDEHNQTIELLAEQIQDYERNVSPQPAVDPIDAIHFRIEQMEMGPKDLIPYIGSQNKVSEVLTRKRPLTLEMIRRLHKALEIPAETFLNEDRK